MSLRQDGRIRKGIVFLVVFAIVTALIALMMYSQDSGSSTTESPGTDLGATIVGSVLMVGWAAIVGAVLLASGLRARNRAKKFNEEDWALATCLSRRLSLLGNVTIGEAYVGAGERVIHSARVAEVERRFDQQTAGSIAGAMEHEFSLFGRSVQTSFGTNVSSGAGFLSGVVRGVSDVRLGLSAVTRDNLMGDALFAVFEVEGPDGRDDTVRAVSMSAPAVGSWITDLVNHVAAQVGGPATHAGATVLQSSGLLTRFATQDVSYTTDRLSAILRRGEESRDITLRGVPIGRGALLVTVIQLDRGPTLRLTPAGLPRMVGAAVGDALRDAQHEVLNSGSGGHVTVSA